MKPILTVLLLLVAFVSLGQSVDYISLRKKNGRVIKNIYSGSRVLLQTTDGSYLEGPVKTVRNDSLLVVVYDIRTYQTVWGSKIRDTLSSFLMPIHYKEIKRIQLSQRRTFFERTLSPLLMIAGAGHFALNLLNGAVFRNRITDEKNLRLLATDAGLFGSGFLLSKIFASNGFSKKAHRFVYVDL